MDPGAHQLFPVQVDAPALGTALVTLHLPVVAVLVTAGDVEPCKDMRVIVKYLHLLHADTAATAAAAAAAAVAALTSNFSVWLQPLHCKDCKHS